MADLVSIQEFLSPDNLAFRAACNEAAEVKNRPVRRRVIARLSKAADTRTVVNHVLRLLSHDLIDDHLFAVELAKNPSWQTLVAEQIAEERRWSDLFEKYISKERIKKLYEWCEPLLSKSFDQTRPATKVVSAALAAVLALGVAHVAKITIPVEFSQGSSKPMSLQLGTIDPDKPIGVQFDAKGLGDALPIHLQFDSAPIKVGLVGEGLNGENPTDTLRKIEGQLEASNKSLYLAQNQLALLASNQGISDISGAKNNIGDLTNAITQTSSNIDKIGANVHDLQASYDTKTAQQIAVADSQSQSFMQQTQILDRALERTSLSINLVEGSSQAVALQSFDPATGKLSAASLTISFNNFFGPPLNGAVIAYRSDDKQTPPGQITLGEGQSTVVPGMGYRLTVDAFERYWFIRRKIYLSLTPEIDGVPMQNPKPATLASR